MKIKKMKSKTLVIFAMFLLGLLATSCSTSYSCVDGGLKNPYRCSR